MDRTGGPECLMDNERDTITYQAIAAQCIIHYAFFIIH